MEQEDYEGQTIPFVKESYSESVEAFKRWLVERALRQAGGTKKLAARILNMDPGHLSRLLKSLNIEGEE